ncbi:hypothetical protein PACTADRAFT_73317 [Pachysolen tannophilus NRRL Y-2460]|uniref:GYF domain-containing protein n=1 Tax=Pachysolen tannophilus NRRL Y-2460 TaxID=669874 RepID=A0A1E4U0T4_PACTA|nr:hypothetical protein PACTADRAFT_73317 [Pachysolen tannophilus NRRL Y-2460]
MSQSFGPAWMRPKNSESGSNSVNDNLGYHLYQDKEKDLKVKNSSSWTSSTGLVSIDHGNGHANGNGNGNMNMNMNGHMNGNINVNGHANIGEGIVSGAVFPSRQSTVTPALSISDTINTLSVPNSPTNNAYIKHKLKNISEIPVIQGSNKYSMEEMFNVWYKLKSQQEIVVDKSFLDDKDQEELKKYRSSDPENEILHLEIAREKLNKKVDSDITLSRLEINDDTNSSNLAQVVALPEKNGLAQHQQAQQQQQQQQQIPIDNINSWSTTGAIGGSLNHGSLNQQPASQSAFLNILSSQKNFQDPHQQHQTQQPNQQPTQPTQQTQQPIGAPPGINAIHQATPSPLLAPQQINWIYLDATGNEQGPFDGTMMQNWYAANYLQPDLKLRRYEESQFKTLSDLINLVGNFQTPFLIPLPDLKYQQQQQQQQQQHHHQNQNQNQSQHQQGSSTLMNVGNRNSNGGAIEAPDSMQIPQSVGSSWLPQSNPTADFLNQRSQSPFSNNVSSPIIGGGASSNPSIAFGLNGTRVGGIGGVDTAHSFISLPSQSQFQAQPQIAPQSIQPVQSTQSVPHAIQQFTAGNEIINGVSGNVDIGNKNSKQANDDTRATTVFTNTHDDGKLKSQVIETQEQIQEGLRSDKQQDQSPAPTQSQSQSQSAPAPAPMTPKLASWAASSSTASQQKKLTLEEIQAQEASEALRREEIKKKLELERNNTAIPKVASPEERSALPKTASWASTTVTTPVKPKKTLADIQKEEAEAAADATRRASASRLPATNLASKLAESKPMSFANALGSGSGSAPSPWTVVTKKTPLPKAVSKTTVPGALHLATKATTPSLLRSVSSSASSAPSAIKPATHGLTTGFSSAASSPTTSKTNPRDEFFVWCRNQLSQLNNGVKKEDVLSIMVQLPTGSESQEIIADTIYSNSSTMDGRKFASEFMKRKIAFEKSIPPNVDFSWGEELYRTAHNLGDSNNDQSNGWDNAFKVVSKKNKKRATNKEF